MLKQSGSHGDKVKEVDLGSLFPLFPQDFGLTAAIAFLWLVCSSAWAKGLQNVKDATGTADITSTLALCKESDVSCEVTDFANMRTLNVSVVSNSTVLLSSYR
jgi:hypothetical protein